MLHGAGTLNTKQLNLLTKQGAVVPPARTASMTSGLPFSGMLQTPSQNRLLLAQQAGALGIR